MLNFALSLTALLSICSQLSESAPQLLNDLEGDQEKIHKHIFVHVAPDEEEEPMILRPEIDQKRETHYKILFIKAPAPATPTLELPAIPAGPDVKTLVYVLQPKHKPLQVPKISYATTQKPAAPQVFFLKYNSGGPAAAGAPRPPVPVFEDRIVDVRSGGAPSRVAPAPAPQAFAEDEAAAATTAFPDAGLELVAAPREDATAGEEDFSVVSGAEEARGDNAVDQSSAEGSAARGAEDEAPSAQDVASETRRRALFVSGRDLPNFEIIRTRGNSRSLPIPIPSQELLQNFQENIFAPSQRQFRFVPMFPGY